MTHISQLESNNENIQNLIDTVKNLPPAGGAVENLSAELATQDELIDELTTVLSKKAGNTADVELAAELASELAAQDSLIAQITEALEGKAVPSGANTVSVTISVASDANNSVMVLRGDRSYEAINGGNTVTIDILYGVVTLVTSTPVNVESTGDYKDLGCGTTMFFSDGGTYKVTKFVNTGGSN